MTTYLNSGDQQSAPDSGAGTSVLERPEVKEETQRSDNGDADPLRALRFEGSHRRITYDRPPGGGVVRQDLGAEARPLPIPGMPGLQAHLRGDVPLTSRQTGQGPCPPCDMRWARAFVLCRKRVRSALGDLVDAGKLLAAEIGVAQGPDIVENLLRLRGAGQHGRDCIVMQQPGQRHLGQCLTTFNGDVVELSDLCCRRSGVNAECFRNRGSTAIRLSEGMPSR